MTETRDGDRNGYRDARTSGEHVELTYEEEAELAKCRELARGKGTVDVDRIGQLVRATYHSAGRFGFGQSTQEALDAAQKRNPERWEQCASTALEALRGLHGVLLREFA